MGVFAYVVVNVLRVTRDLRHFVGESKKNRKGELLRVLEQKEFERVGGTRTLPMNARIVSSTNKDLAAGIRNGSFREDFYYRLRTVPLTLPPLRERVDDGIELALLLGLVFPVGVHRQPERVFPLVPVLDLDGAGRSDQAHALKLPQQGAQRLGGLLKFLRRVGITMTVYH